MLPEVVLNPENFSGHFRFGIVLLSTLFAVESEVMGTMAK
jgi:hypothetical protein